MFLVGVIGMSLNEKCNLHLNIKRDYLSKFVHVFTKIPFIPAVIAPPTSSRKSLIQINNISANEILTLHIVFVPLHYI